jgi:flagellar biosynthesis chaperone FliJ
MKFQFRLQKALHFLQMKETVKRMEVAAAMQRVNFLQNRIADVERSLRDLLARHPGVETDWAPYQTSKIALDAKELGRLSGLLTTEKLALEKKQRELSRLLMRKKGLEGLREKHLAEHRLEESRRMQKNIDESVQTLRRYR